MRLVIANKLYSSWSMRPWLVMRAFEIAFEETVIPLRRPESKTEISRYSPSGKVPVLVDGDVVVWESLAIISYLDCRFSDKGIFPLDIGARAHALSISHEMHGGFQALRQACPMNLGKRFAAEHWSQDVLANVARIETLWRDTRDQFGGDGAFLFGAYGAADAMFAPIVCRLNGYGFELAADTRAYMDAVLSHAPMQAWRSDAFKETWLIEDYEEGHVVEDVLYDPIPVD